MRTKPSCVDCGADVCHGCDLCGTCARKRVNEMFDLLEDEYLSS